MLQTDEHRCVGRQAGRARRWVLAVALLAFVYTTGTFLAPVLMSAGSPWGGLLRLSYGPVCHQQIERSLPVEGGYQAICARCSGLYLGGVAGLFAGALFLVGRRGCPRPFWLAAVALPSLVDALLPWVGLPGSPNRLRLLLALPVGFVAALFLARGIEEIITPRRTRPVSSTRDPDDQETDWITRRQAGRESLEVVDG